MRGNAHVRFGSRGMGKHAGCKTEGAPRSYYDKGFLGSGT